MSKSASIKEQIRRNLVALISLAVAVTSLGYNTWRNEASEYNRNQRLVILNLLGQFPVAISGWSLSRYCCCSATSSS